MTTDLLNHYYLPTSLFVSSSQDAATSQSSGPQTTLLPEDKDGDIQRVQTTYTFASPDPARRRRRIETKQVWTRLRRLGRGGYGVVFLEQESAGDLRAVKRVVKSTRREDDHDCLREVLSVALFSKDKTNFPTFFGWFDDAEFLYIAMEYFEHGDLHQCLSEAGKAIEEKEAQLICFQIAEALEAIHERNITHRDLKPNNVFIVRKAPQWWVKLGDFGIAKRVQNQDTSLHTTFIGAYVAPEVLGLVDIDEDLPTPYTSAVDIWSLGCVTYWLMTLQILFPPAALRRYCLAQKLPPGLLDNDSFSQSGLAFIKQCVDMDPKTRPTATQALELQWLAFGDEDNDDDDEDEFVTANERAQPVAEEPVKSVISEYDHREEKNKHAVPTSEPILAGSEDREWEEFRDTIHRKWAELRATQKTLVDGMHSNSNAEFMIDVGTLAKEVHTKFNDTPILPIDTESGADASKLSEDQQISASTVGGLSQSQAHHKSPQARKFKILRGFVADTPTLKEMSCISVRYGEEVELLGESDNGWLFVKKGRILGRLPRSVLPSPMWDFSGFGTSYQVQRISRQDVVLLEPEENRLVHIPIHTLLPLDIRFVSGWLRYSMPAMRKLGAEYDQHPSTEEHLWEFYRPYQTMRPHGKFMRLERGMLVLQIKQDLVRVYPIEWIKWDDVYLKVHVELCELPELETQRSHFKWDPRDETRDSCNFGERLPSFPTHPLESNIILSDIKLIGFSLDEVLTDEGDYQFWALKAKDCAILRLASENLVEQLKAFQERYTGMQPLGFQVKWRPKQTGPYREKNRSSCIIDVWWNGVWLENLHSASWYPLSTLETELRIAIGKQIDPEAQRKLNPFRQWDMSGLLAYSPSPVPESAQARSPFSSQMFVM